MKKSFFTIQTKLSECCKKFAKKPAFILNNGKTISYKDMNWDISRTSQLLREQGICKNSKVALFVSNDALFLETFLAITKLGAVALLLRPEFSQKVITSIIQEEKPEAFFVQNTQIDFIPEDVNISILQITDNKILKSANRTFSISGYIVKSTDAAAILFSTTDNNQYTRRIITQKELAIASKNIKSKEKAEKKQKTKIQNAIKLQSAASIILGFAKLLTGKATFTN